MKIFCFHFAYVNGKLFDLMNFSQQPLLELLENLRKVSTEEVEVINKIIDHFKEAVGGRCSVKKVFLKISQNLPRNIYVGVSFLIKLQLILKKRLQHRCFTVNLCEIFKNTFSYRTLPVAASGFNDVTLSAIVTTSKGTSG